MATRIPFSNTWFNPSPVLPTKRSTSPAQSAGSAADRVIQSERFQADSEQDWRELVCDIVALANSGGGRIVIPAAISENDVHQWLTQYADAAGPDITLHLIPSTATATTEIAVRPAASPIAVSGSFYFRHDERSEPGTTADMRAFFERVIRRVRRRWLRGIRRVLQAPLADILGTPAKHAAAKQKSRDLANLQPVRIVTDPDAPALHPQDVDRLYPWRQKDLLRELNTRLGRRMLTSYDIQAVRRQHRLDERPEFVFNLPGAGRRYSPALADWMLDEFGRDPEFFTQARAADQAMLRLRRQKPR